MENRVEELRKHLGLNQEDFAKAIRVSRQTVSSIETGNITHLWIWHLKSLIFLERELMKFLSTKGVTRMKRVIGYAG